jgi:hypothetical protein
LAVNLNVTFKIIVFGLSLTLDHVFFIRMVLINLWSPSKRAVTLQFRQSSQAGFVRLVPVAEIINSTFNFLKGRKS